MSDAAAATADSTDAPPKKSKKMLFIILGVVLLLALAGGGGVLFYLKSQAHDDEEGDAPKEEEVHYEAPEPGTPPTFLPLDPMVINLADPGGNRYAQLGITLQLQDAKTEEAIKPFMPAIRNGILMLISQRTSAEMLKIEGKEELVRDIIAEVSHVMGYQVNEPDEGDDHGSTKKRRKKRHAPPNPVQDVLFSSFIVQ